MHRTLKIGVRNLAVFTDDDDVYVVQNGVAGGLRIRAAKENICVRLESAILLEPPTETEETPEKSYEINGLVIGHWDSSTIVVSNESAGRCSFLITTGEEDFIIMNMNRGMQLRPEIDVEVTFAADEP